MEPTYICIVTVCIILNILKLSKFAEEEAFSFYRIQALKLERLWKGNKSHIRWRHLLSIGGIAGWQGRKNEEAPRVTSENPRCDLTIIETRVQSKEQTGLMLQNAIEKKWIADLIRIGHFLWFVVTALMCWDSWDTDSGVFIHLSPPQSAGS